MDADVDADGNFAPSNRRRNGRIKLFDPKSAKDECGAGDDESRLRQARR